VQDGKDSRTIIMACPVGTSLSSNISKEPWQELAKFLDKFLQNGQIVDIGQAAAYFGGAVESWVKTLPSLRTSFPTAELQSIVRWLLSDTFKQAFGEKPLKIDLRLFPSKNSLSCATAYMTLCVLRELQSKKFWDENVTICVKKPEPLDIQVENAEVFDESIDRLFQKYDELRGNKEENGELMINVTGGYKAICAFSLIYAQLQNLRCVYSFEGNENTAAVELPLLPVSYSLEALDDEISMLKGLNSLESLSGMDMSTLPAWLRNLLPRKGKKMSPMGTMLLKHYGARRGSAGAIGSGMLDQLGTDARGVRDYLENCIKTAWSQLWLGDQIPETVEHSRRHSKRLMELAGNLYRCAPEQLGTIGMRKPETLALLISAIYLHDIGHTLMAHPVSEDARKVLGGVFPLGSFPSCVREVHHLLSAEVMDGQKEELFPKEDGIGENFREMLMELVPYISEHHRGYTTLTRKQGVSDRCKKTVRSVGELLYGEKFTETLRPLEKRLEGKKSKMEEWNLLPKEVLTTAALLRVLDGCDVQADRVVSEEYMKARLARTKAEGDAIWWELRPLLRAGWENFAGPCDRIHEISRHLKPEDASQGKLSADPEKSSPKELEILCKNIYAAVTDALLALKAQSGGYLATSRNRADLMTLSLVNRYAFKWEQFLHFYKHRCVSFVLPVRKENQVLLKIFPDQAFVKDNQEMQSNLDHVCEDIRNEIAYTDGLLETILTQEGVRLA
jgi:hypothetical protein